MSVLKLCCVVLLMFIMLVGNGAVQTPLHHESVNCCGTVRFVSVPLSEYFIGNRKFTCQVPMWVVHLHMTTLSTAAGEVGCLWGSCNLLWKKDHTRAIFEVTLASYCSDCRTLLVTTCVVCVFCTFEDTWCIVCNDVYFPRQGIANAILTASCTSK